MKNAKNIKVTDQMLKELKLIYKGGRTFAQLQIFLAKYSTKNVKPSKRKSDYMSSSCYSTIENTDKQIKERETAVERLNNPLTFDTMKSKAKCDTASNTLNANSLQGTPPQITSPTLSGSTIKQMRRNQVRNFQKKNLIEEINKKHQKIRVEDSHLKANAQNILLLQDTPLAKYGKN